MGDAVLWRPQPNPATLTNEIAVASSVTGRVIVGGSLHGVSMDTTDIADAAEKIVRDAASAFTRAEARECLGCFVNRQVDEFGCDTTHRYVEAYRDQRAPNATALTSRLSGMGGFCDCEIFMNAFQPASRLWLRRESTDIDEDEWDDELDVEWDPPVSMPPCAGVRPLSTQPCINWQRII